MEKISHEIQLINTRNNLFMQQYINKKKFQ